MFAYSAFVGSSWQDHAIADIRAIFSHDDGETWSEDKLIIKCEDLSSNYMCISFLRMNNGDISLYFGMRHTYENRKCTKLMVIRSSDEGQTWTKPEIAININEYLVIENDRTFKLKSGRIIIPASMHRYDKDAYANLGVGEIIFFASDDDGKTFKQISKVYSLPYKDRTGSGLQEPGIIQLDDGKIFCYARTKFGSQFESFSEDNGETWTEFIPSTVFYSPLSPMLIKHVADKKYSVAVYNPYPGNNAKFSRTPLVAQIVKGEGEHFWEPIKSTFYLEEDMEKYYSYPAIYDGGDYFLVAYYIAKMYKDKDVGFGDMKITKVKFSDIEKALEKAYFDYDELVKSWQ